MDIGWEISTMLTMLAGAWTFSLVTFFGLGSLFHVYYFVYKKEQKDEWKIQPKRWPSEDKIKMAMKYTAINLAFGGITGVLLATHVLNGGWSMLYLDASELPWFWHVISFFVCLAMMDAYLYYSHRLLHTPNLYKKYHSLHHRFLDPQIFTTVAMHPVEFMFFQGGLILPMFVLPQWWVVYMAAIVYTMIIGLIDHCGVRFKMPRWTLHGGDNTFHDDHHKYFHTNYGHHTPFWDKLHGTDRKEDRQYGEKVFGGKGATK